MRHVVLCILLSGVAANTSAKRSPPEPVPSVEALGIRYEVLPFGCTVTPEVLNEDGSCAIGGILRAFDVESDRLLWTLRIYRVDYDPGLETDVQDVFITKMTIDDQNLFVENEADEAFRIDLTSRQVEQIR